MDQMRGIAQQEGPLVQRLVDEREVAEIEIAQTPGDQLRGNTARAGGEISLVDEGDAQPAERRIKGNAGAGDAAAEDEQVEGLLREHVDVTLHAFPCWLFDVEGPGVRPTQ